MGRMLVHCFSSEITRAKAKSELTKSYKKRLVEEGRAHAALVFDGDVCVAWCQFGPLKNFPIFITKKKLSPK
jgi:hypothetical protein